uniref:Putative glutaredoxin domain-containing cysteine-rich protein 1 n=1 Tax=Davidia involucrata TaxID=16924 RepID=A0A5B7BMU2_DAVIN
MGCASSKQIQATIDVYRPAPSSFAVFDIDAIKEPWLMMNDTQQQQQQEKPTHVPAPILEKLNAFESDAPHSWDEVSKALEDLKPTLHNPTPPPPNPNPIHTLHSPPPPAQDSTVPVKQAPRKSVSFHTLEELDAKISSNSKPAHELRKTESMRTQLKKTESRVGFVPAVTESLSEGYKPLRENIFLVRDRIEREREGKAPSLIKRDPLSDYPEKCPPGGSDVVALYTTSLGGVRRTYEDCNRVRSILETHRVVFDERDVSLHGEFLNELRDLLGEGVSVPRMFVKGRYVGGVEEVVSLNETGRLGRMMNWARVERGVGWQACEGCGGARFVPCLECGGSCKVLIGDTKERCPKCNENGLVHCPVCH